MKRYTVYCHTNRSNGKSYIGWTSYTIDQRWDGHCYASSRGADLLFSRAIRKHGLDVWDHEILEVMTTEESAKRAEILWIAERKTYAFDPDGYGYNMTRGGDGAVGGGHSRLGKSCPWNSYARSQAQKDHLKKVCSGRRHTPEEIQKQIVAQTGKRFSEKRKQTLRKPKSDRTRMFEAQRLRRLQQFMPVIALLQRGLTPKEVANLLVIDRKRVNRALKSAINHGIISVRDHG